MRLDCVLQKVMNSYLRANCVEIPSGEERDVVRWDEVDKLFKFNDEWSHTGSKRAVDWWNYERWFADVELSTLPTSVNMTPRPKTRETRPHVLTSNLQWECPVTQNSLDTWVTGNLNGFLRQWQKFKDLGQWHQMEFYKNDIVDQL